MSADWHSLCVAKPPLIARRRSSVSMSSPPQAGQALLGLALYPEASVAVLAALGGGHADVDVELPGCAAPTDGAPHGVFVLSRLSATILALRLGFGAVLVAVERIAAVLAFERPSALAHEQAATAFVSTPAKVRQLGDVVGKLQAKQGVGPGLPRAAGSVRIARIAHIDVHVERLQAGVEDIAHIDDGGVTKDVLGDDLRAIGHDGQAARDPAGHLAFPFANQRHKQAAIAAQRIPETYSVAQTAHVDDLLAHVCEGARLRGLCIGAGGQRVAGAHKAGARRLKGAASPGVIGHQQLDLGELCPVSRAALSVGLIAKYIAARQQRPFAVDRRSTPNTRPLKRP